MPTDNAVRMIHSKTPDSAAMLANVKRAMAITARLNRLTFDDADEIRELFSQLIGKKVDASFLLIPPFYTAGGDEIRVGGQVFVNQNCTFYDLGGLDIADDVLIGPNVSIITIGHPLEPSQRRAATIGKPIVIERGVWIAAGAIIIGGVTIGEHSVVAAGSVVTKDVPARRLSEETRRGSFARLESEDASAKVETGTSNGTAARKRSAPQCSGPATLGAASAGHSVGTDCLEPASVLPRRPYHVWLAARVDKAASPNAHAAAHVGFAKVENQIRKHRRGREGRPVRAGYEGTSSRLEARKACARRSG